MLHKKATRLLTATVLALLVLTGTGLAEESTDEIWTDSEIDPAAVQPGVVPDLPEIQPDFYRPLSLDLGALLEIINTAPLEESRESYSSFVVLTLPLPAGGFGRFRIEESPIMEPALAEKYPEISTFRGIGIDDRSAAARIDLTPQGFHAMILSSGPTIYIDPWQRGDLGRVIAYRKNDLANPRAEPFSCDVDRGDEPDFLLPRSATPTQASGATLRKYRLAVAATCEYTAFHGGTKALGMAAIVTAMNRVNGIYERDVAIRMKLIANNDDVVYAGGSCSDPYTNSSGSTMLSQNQTNLDAEIGDANYDIGHVFSTGGGGVASLGVPCKSGSKARGVTGLGSPIGDPFYVDYVAHEMGHQWGAHHTFNGDAGNCSGGNRSADHAYEPGSGSTIMAYAGICADQNNGDQNLQSNSDDHFHTESYDEIVNYSTNLEGNSCAVQTATGNSAPIVDAGPGGHTIPKSTPIMLCPTSVSDPDFDPVTYNWEEFDLGPAGHPDAPVGDAPIFRSFPSSTDPCRILPKVSDLVAGTHTIGELLPTYARSLQFRLTVRDNQSGGGGVDRDAFGTALTVTDLAGPFLVTAPDNTASIPSCENAAVKWRVSGTDAAPVNCASVDIELSVDGGYTFPFLLTSATANDGRKTVLLPGADTTQGRFRVSCTDNVFFNISEDDLTIDPPAGGNVEVTSHTVTGPDTEIFEAANELYVHTDFIVAGGEAILRAGSVVVLGNGVTVDGGDLTIENVSGLCPPP